MIHPNMATCLGVLLTNARIPPSLLRSALVYAADRSFNCISVDGDTSTNDSLVVLANGQPQERNGAVCDIREEKSRAFEQFREALTETARKLAQLIVRDGEGVTKFATVEVTVSIRGYVA